MKDFTHKLFILDQKRIKSLNIHIVFYLLFIILFVIYKWKKREKAKVTYGTGKGHVSGNVFHGNSISWTGIFFILKMFSSHGETRTLDILFSWSCVEIEPL